MFNNRSVNRSILMSMLMTGIGIQVAVAAIPLRYHVTDLGTLGGSDSSGEDINASGHVTGTSYTTDGANRAFLYDGTMHDLGSLGAESYGSGINASGHVTGSSWTVEHAPGCEQLVCLRAFLYDGTMHDLGTLDGNYYSGGVGINNSGQVTGYSWTGGGSDPGSVIHAFLYDDGTMHDLGTLGTQDDLFSYGNGINSSGQVTGLSQTSGYDNHAFLWTPTTPNGASGTMHDLGTLGGTSSSGHAINASGQVTGGSDTIGDSAQHAFLWTPTTPNTTSGTMRDLGTLGGTVSLGLGINAGGQVVGVSDGYAFLYSSGSGMVDLNSLINPRSGWVLYGARAINDAGQITGYGLIGGEQHAFLLTPVPEPASAVLFGLAALGLVLTFVRRECGFPCAGRNLVVMTVVLLASAGPASAATLSASSVAELIVAIDAANQNAEPDTIALAAGTTFTLSEVNNTTTNGSTGLPTITANENLTIFGNGGIIERSTDVGTPSFRLFDVTAGASLALENLTLQGGLAGGRPARGGAIFSQGNLALLGVTVQNNIAQGTPGSNCFLCGGGSGGPSPGGPGGWGLGGGIYSVGSLLLENSTLQNNQAQGGRGGSSRGPGARGGRGGNGEGGGLYAAAGTATLLGSIVTDNIAQGAVGGSVVGPGSHSGAPGQGVGGGIYIANAQVGLDDFTLAHVTSNTATTSNPNIYGPFEVLPNPLPGDHNGNGTVDAADYTVWRDRLGSPTSLPNDDTAGVGPDDYGRWKLHFGEATSAIGSGSGAANPLSRVPRSAAPLSAVVPEPATALLLLIGGLFGVRRRRGLQVGN